MSIFPKGPFNESDIYSYSQGILRSRELPSRGLHLSAPAVGSSCSTCNANCKCPTTPCHPFSPWLNRFTHSTLEGPCPLSLVKHIYHFVFTDALKFEPVDPGGLSLPPKASQLLEVVKGLPFISKSSNQKPLPPVRCFYTWPLNLGLNPSVIVTLENRCRQSEPVPTFNCPMEPFT